MNLNQLKKYCLSKPSVTSDFPFDETVLVFRLAGKMFALTNLKDEFCEVNLKCDPGYAEFLRGKYPEVMPGYHMNKMHWNTVKTEKGNLEDDFIQSLIDHSYDLIFAGLPKKTQATIDYELKENK